MHLIKNKNICLYKERGNIYMITCNRSYIKNTIKEELQDLKFNFKHVGTSYLLDSIYLLYSLKKYYKFNLESDVYPAIANRYGDNARAIKGSISYAIDRMVEVCDKEYLMNYLYEDEYRCDEIEDDEIGPKKIIRAILKRIKDL